MNTKEFKKYCNDKKPAYFAFNSDGQILPDDMMCAFYSMTFSSISISYNPNIVVFRGDSSMMTLVKVKSINVCDEYDGTFETVTIVCGGHKDNEGVSYSFVMV